MINVEFGNKDSRLLRVNFIAELVEWATRYDALEVSTSHFTEADVEAYVMLLIPATKHNNSLLESVLFMKDGTCVVRNNGVTKMLLSWKEGSAVLLDAVVKQGRADIERARKLAAGLQELTPLIATLKKPS